MIRVATITHNTETNEWRLAWTTEIDKGDNIITREDAWAVLVANPSYKRLETDRLIESWQFEQTI